MDKIKNIGLSLVTSIKNEIFDDKNEQNDRYIPEDVSPTTRKFMAKFNLQDDECVISNYSCALYNKILLQGHMYLTTKRLCFFSAFNNKNLIFSESTKLMIPYEEILAIEKKKTAVLFDNAIQITTIKEGEVKFCTLLKRDATYDLLYDLVFNYTQSFQNEFIIENNIPNIEEDQPYDARVNDQIEVDKADIIEVQPENYFQFEESKCRDFEEEKHADGIVHWHFDQKLINRLNDLAEVNRGHLQRFDEEFSNANFKEYNEIGSEIYPNMDIRAFFNMIYGDYLYENGQTFLSNYAEKSGSTAIIEQPREIPVPNYFSDFSKHKVKSEENLDESIIKAFNTVQHTSYNLDYDCEVYMLNMKSDCHVNAVCKSFFLSPTKICILNKFPNTGTKYSEFFTPMTISILEQIVDFESQTISVKQTFMVGVKFHKPILFFQGKIKSLVMDKLKDNIEKIMIPMIKESIS